MRLHLADLQAWVAGSRLGMVADGAVLGAVLAVAVAVSGSGGEFIYFQF